MAWLDSSFYRLPFIRTPVRVNKSVASERTHTLHRQLRKYNYDISSFLSGRQDRDVTRELGGWVNVQRTGSQWETPHGGETLTFTPWEKGSPDNLQRTNCVGLTVTERSEGWKDYMCHHRANMLYPICQVRGRQVLSRRCDLVHEGSAMSIGYDCLWDLQMSTFVIYVPN